MHKPEGGAHFSKAANRLGQSGSASNGDLRRNQNQSVREARPPLEPPPPPPPHSAPSPPFASRSLQATSLSLNQHQLNKSSSALSDEVCHFQRRPAQGEEQSANIQQSSISFKQIQLKWKSVKRRSRELANRYSKMVLKRYYILLFCFSLIIISCLLASLVISRSIGTDLDTSRSADSSEILAPEARLANGAQSEPLELRTLELVDLTECGKTFAYSKLQIQFEVPKWMPEYKQHPMTLDLNADNNNNNSLADLRRANPSTEDAKAVFSEDPLELAAERLGIPFQAVSNTTLVDCFIVDTEKRLGQKQALERRHQLVARTRQVDFHKMLALIVGCRQLTWTSLNNRELAGDQSAPSNRLDLVRPLEPVNPAALDNSVGPMDSLSARQQQRPDFLSAILNGIFGPSPAPATPAEMETGASEQQPQLSTRLALEVARGAARNDQAGLTKAANAADPRGSYLNIGMSMVSGIVPNTLWCGLGDRAANYSELGAEYKVDSCCRAHDHCPVRLRPFATDYGLINWSMSTRSHCECDIEFNDCLATINSTLSNVLRVLYFRFVGLQCLDVSGKQVTLTSA